MRIKSAVIRYNGKVYTGYCHADIGLRMLEEGVCQAPYPSGDDQGFITECGEYVRRAPALAIAIEVGQVVAGKTCSNRHLFSEDLW